MKQKIIIKNFGPIKDVEMEIDDFTIFIGPQTSGKSTIAKSVFFFLSLRDNLIIYLQSVINDKKINQINELEEFKSLIRQELHNYWGKSDLDFFELYLKYWYSEDVWIEIEFNKENGYIDVVYFSDDFLSKIKSSVLSFNISDLQEAPQKKLDKLKHRIEEIFGFDGVLIFIPSGRSILSPLARHIKEVNQENFDFLVWKFIEQINTSKWLKGSDDLDFYNLHGKLGFEEKTIKLLKGLAESILKGSYSVGSKSEDLIIMKGSYFTKLLHASSGQQETVWIIQIILILILNKQKVFIVIEEPEAHLFPKTQKDILNLIVLLSNTSDNKIFITTHSPYLLTSLNNNIYAYQVGQENEEKVDKIIDKKLWMNPKKVQAYFVGGEGNKGKIRSIIDPDLKIIQSEEIDSASSINNNEFDQLFDLE
jgi:ABC-type cobalamin/Fe3+-siderophores transport system ATPase subunit